MVGPTRDESRARRDTLPSQAISARTAWPGAELRHERLQRLQSVFGYQSGDTGCSEMVEETRSYTNKIKAVQGKMFTCEKCSPDQKQIDGPKTSSGRNGNS